MQYVALSFRSTAGLSKEKRNVVGYLFRPATLVYRERLCLEYISDERALVPISELCFKHFRRLTEEVLLEDQLRSGWISSQETRFKAEINQNEFF